MAPATARAGTMAAVQRALRVRYAPSRWLALRLSLCASPSHSAASNLGGTSTTEETEARSDL